MFRSLSVGAACIGLGLAPAQARSAHSFAQERPPAPAASPVRPIAAVVPEGQPVCTHARRRLWIEGEGWVVRKVATCR